MISRLSLRSSGCLIASLFLFACVDTGPVPLRYGEDICDYCRMTVVEQNFGSELITSKGKVYRFDSIECLAAFVAATETAVNDRHSLWVTDFAAAPVMLLTSDAIFVHTDNARSPMGIGLFAFSSQAEASNFSEEHAGSIIDWAGALKVVLDAWKLEGQGHGES